ILYHGEVKPDVRQEGRALALMWAECLSKSRNENTRSEDQGDSRPRNVYLQDLIQRQTELQRSSTIEFKKGVLLRATIQNCPTDEGCRNVETEILLLTLQENTKITTYQELVNTSKDVYNDPNSQKTVLDRLERLAMEFFSALIL